MILVVLGIFASFRLSMRGHSTIFLMYLSCFPSFRLSMVVCSEGFLHHTTCASYFSKYLSMVVCSEGPRNGNKVFSRSAESGRRPHKRILPPLFLIMMMIMMMMEMMMMVISVILVTIKITSLQQPAHPDDPDHLQEIVILVAGGQPISLICHHPNHHHCHHLGDHCHHHSS